MAFFRSSLSAALLSVSLVACGGSGSGQPTPEGMHYHYVANKVNVPTSNSQAHEYGLDLNGDGTVDNQLGSVLGTLSGLNFDIQGTVDKAVAEGSIILLLDFQTKDFTSASASGLQAFLGTNPVPAACNAGETYNLMTKTGCGHHLTGTGMFSIDSSSPNNMPLAGPVAGGTFTGGPGKISLQIALGGTQAINLDLIGARAKGSAITSTTIGAGGSGGMVLAGALTQDDLNNKVLPAVTNEVQGIVVRDCCGTGNTMNPTCNYNGTPSCGCMANSTGSTILGEFDTNHDCMVTLDELQNNNIIQSFLAPDVMIDTQTNQACKTAGGTCAAALSLGIQVTAVGAQYTAPGE